MRIPSATIVAVLLACGTGTPPVGEAEAPDSLFTALRDSSTTARRVVADVHDMSTEGGDATGYYDAAGALFLVDLALMGETGRREHAFACAGGPLRAVQERSHVYNRPYYWDAAAAAEAGDEAFDPAKTVVKERTVLFDGDTVARIIPMEMADDADFGDPASLPELFAVMKRLLTEADTLGSAAAR
ncbi:MAG: hypothetical protein RBT71_03700 [Flavobacteriales bacterium]|jgi:hypothetical protein|nr:hypothetical protein [Flavobacteriales bacterium]